MDELTGLNETVKQAVAPGTICLSSGETVNKPVANE